MPGRNCSTGSSRSAPFSSSTTADLGALPEDQAVRTLNFVESQASYKDNQAQLKAAAQTHGLDYALVKAVTATESTSRVWLG